MVNHEVTEVCVYSTVANNKRHGNKKQCISISIRIFCKPILLLTVAIEFQSVKTLSLPTERYAFVHCSKWINVYPMANAILSMFAELCSETQTHT